MITHITHGLQHALQQIATVTHHHQWHELLTFNLVQCSQTSPARSDLHVQSMGDIHHFAWRPSDVSAAAYKNKTHIAEPIRYKDWLPEECHARECLEPQVGFMCV